MNRPVASSEGPPGVGVGGVGSILRPALFAFGLALLLFGAFELAERSWLSGAELEDIYAFHRLRGAAAALVAGTFASWLILRRAPSLLAGPVAPERAGAGRIVPEEKRLHFARWFVLMRWIAVVVTSLLAIGAVYVFGLLPPEVAPKLAATVAVLALANLGYALHLRTGRVGPLFLPLQVGADVAILIVLLHLSGGIENPLTPLTLLNVIIAGIVLDRRQTYLVAGGAALLFAFFAGLEWSRVLPHYQFAVFPHPVSDGVLLHAAHDPLYVGSRVLVQAATLFLVAFFTTSLTERIRDDELRLERFADDSAAQAQLLERALETTETAICVHDRELQTEWANERWRTWLQVIPELCGDGGAALSPTVSTLEDGRIRVEEIGVPGPTGSGDRDESVAPDRVFQVVTAPLLDRDGGISHVVKLARDVTDQKVAQARVIRAERLSALGELAGQVAHEVNNPIAILSAKARLLLRDHRAELPAKAAAEITKIIELADRVARIAQGLLSSCRPAPGPLTPLDVRDPARKVLAHIEARAAELGVRVHDELPAGLPPVLANGAELEQVFLNLFLNALDAMPFGGVLHLAARGPVPLESGEEAVEVVVEDTGHGIPAAVKSRIFEPFLTTKPVTRGSGLGLSICLGLVRSHGGQIEVESEPGRFTRVLLRLRTAPHVPRWPEPWSAPALPEMQSHV